MTGLFQTFDFSAGKELKGTGSPVNSSEITEIFSAIEGCDYILHVASPWPIVADEHTITVAVQGTENVLKAAATVPTVKKIVLTSSCAAINGTLPLLQSVSYL